MSDNVWPPPAPSNENDDDRAARLAAEREAKRISDEIDRALENERQELRKRRPETKILLLGQAESGKSTMVKNFQLYFCPTSFHAEAEAWRTVIHLNLARFVNYIFTLLSTTHPDARQADPNLRVIQMRLSPLKQVEIILSRAISADSRVLSPIDEKATWRTNPAPSLEVSIRSGTGWKSLMKRRRGSNAKAPKSLDELDDARQIFHACKEDIVALSKSAVIDALEKEGVDLQTHARYFFDHAARVADKAYKPTTDDILRARLRTLGVEEYRMSMETAAEKGTDWVFYDVGGARNQRAAWASYFDDVNAVIFLCPMSGFDQQLAEDNKVNRLQDSMELWQTVCRSKLLANSTFILLLNKADLLFAKLKTVQFADHVPGYEDRPNKAEYVADFLREQMIAVHRKYSPKKRQLHHHVTCAIDTKVMSAVLSSIREVILVSMLQDMTLL